MPIDIHFLQRFPDSFFEQNNPNGDANFFRLLRDADTNHDFQLTGQELIAMDPGMRSPASQDNLYRTCAFIGETLRTGQIDIRNNPPNFSLFEPRSSHRAVSYTWSHPHIDRDRNLVIDRSEILTQLTNSITPRIDLLENRLRRAEEGLLAMESHSENRGLMNLLNIATWIPFQIIPNTRANNLHEQIRIYAQQRHEIRGSAIDRFIHDLRTHPTHSVVDALYTLSEQDRTILIDDLLVQHWQHVLTTATPEESIRAHLDIAEGLMVGRDSTYMLGGMKSLDELLLVPWRAENYAMAHDIISLLENSPLQAQFTPAQRARFVRLRLDIGSPNQEFIQNLPPAHDNTQRAINTLVQGVLGLVQLPRRNSLNEISDFMGTVAAEVFLLRGAFRAYKVTRAAVVPAIGRLAQSAWRSLTAAAIASTPAETLSGVVSASTATVSQFCASNTRTCATSLGAFYYLKAGAKFIGSALGLTISRTSAVAGAAMVTNITIPPERHYTETHSLELPEPDLQNPWVDANLASLAVALYLR